MIRGLDLKGETIVGPAQLDLDDDQIHDLHKAAAQRKSLRLAAGTKATVMTGTAGAYTEQLLPPVTFSREPTRVSSLFPIVATERPSVEYYVTAGTTTAAAVAEGALKPESDLALTRVIASATKVAHRLVVSDEALADIGDFLQFVGQDMIAGLVKAENDLILNAVAAGAQTWNGLLTTTGILTRAKGADTPLDAIEQAITDLRVGASFIAPDAIVMHPSN